MNVTNPGGPPAGLNRQVSQNLTAGSNADGSLFINGDIVCFQFDGSDDINVTCNAAVIDDAGNGPIAAGSVQVVGPATGCVQFQGFPPRADGSSRMDSCQWAVNIVNNISQASVSVALTIYA
ncbi:MAG: hypothetical protein JWL77_3556 [Chthonomonadaceae bacterium]|nr:hypothetical protein [Chthonomonadaceae bacterium]